MCIYMHAYISAERERFFVGSVSLNIAASAGRKITYLGVGIADSDSRLYIYASARETVAVQRSPLLEKRSFIERLGIWGINLYTQRRNCFFFF